ncbi:MAG: tRNA (adenosine(37)-N6)-dimethylallyltransferase MiaA [Gemmatimonadota bacterium]|nr:tRNA (adenosine(37)-N6)-dimethylallyltransferase MiaA [Gemmatimonadota bacterium]
MICGPTAAGKSPLALALAERFGATILSADSRQIYRGFDVGTAKPTAAERARVPHRGVDLIEPVERWSAAAWADAAERWIAEAFAARRTPVVVGGTGFYVRALTRPLFAEPPLDAERRRRLEGELASCTTGELRARCEQLDPPRAALGRAQLLRAISVATLTGTPLSEWHRGAARPARVRARFLVVDPGPALGERIVTRTGSMLSAGWEREVIALEQRVPDEAPAWNGTGYRVVRDLVRGKIAAAAATQRIIIETRQYAKRQRTWIRHQLPLHDVTLLDPSAHDALERASDWWLDGGGGRAA